ncbi:lytic transglycosylase domain-containing protein [Streptomyces sp. NPDC006368]|uniref:lytic transglycosylase domain-containing protein n=1 Tax=Streptomyces sp. NPDC006368 TaxID=3156760 RepID=UPI0033A4182A
MTTGRRLRRGVGGTATAVAAMAALTASQAPGLVPPPDPAGDRQPARRASAAPPSDDAYHTELPPLVSPVSPGAPEVPPPPSPAVPAPPVAVRMAQAGIPATVLAAYRRAEAAVARTDPGCRLPWQLLAAIGKVESGQARGGRVDARGTTLSPILGPVLDGNGFARIMDTDGGAYDGDRGYDRAVGPMQFIPSTWARWGADGNGDGRRDPGNIHDAALAAGRYLCAGERTLTVKADLDRAILSYNHSDAYLRTVLAWLAFYQRGAHPVPDGSGVLPASPGAGSADTGKGTDTGQGAGAGAKPSPRPGGGGGIVVGPQPSGSPKPSPVPRPPSRPSPSAPPSRPTSPPPSPSPTPSPTPSTSPTPAPSPSPSTPPGTPSPTPTPSDPSPTPPAPTCPAPTPTPTATPTDSPPPAPGPPGTSCSAVAP